MQVGCWVDGYPRIWASRVGGCRRGKGWIGVYFEGRADSRLVVRVSKRNQR